MHGITNGSILQLEDFDNGGEGVAYRDNDATNSGGAYRTNAGVDIENGTTGVTNVGWTNAGEWMEYTCNVDPGTCNITLGGFPGWSSYLPGSAWNINTGTLTCQSHKMVNLLISSFFLLYQS
jgi:hypothetical protein